MRDAVGGEARLPATQRYCQEIQATLRVCKNEGMQAICMQEPALVAHVLRQVFKCGDEHTVHAIASDFDFTSLNCIST